MYKALIAAEKPISSASFKLDLEDAGFDVIADIQDMNELTQSAVRSMPDLVIAATTSPSDLMFEAARMLGVLAPCPFILFTADSDVTKIDRATESNMHVYVVDGYAKHRLRSIIQVARARFRHEQLLKEELSDLSKRFEERKIVDRAKGVLMRSRGVNEEEAFEMLRSLAMKSRIRIGIAAKSVIDMSRAGEAVNRAGQLRMLSQRMVKCYAQALHGLEANEALNILTDSVARVESNLAILDKAISATGYGDLVARVKHSWQKLAGYFAKTPKTNHIEIVNQLAELMLKDAENLTNFLESSGLVATLHILNISGRQRMLSQRITKCCFLLALSPSASLLEELHALCDKFQQAHDYLSRAPLSTPLITKDLIHANTQWLRLLSTLQNLQHEDALAEISDASERLLDSMERLTDQYEQAMQMLIGDRLGTL